MLKAPLFVIMSLSTFSVSAANCLLNCPTGKTGQVVTRQIYTLQNNSKTKFADWVAYRVTKANIDGPSRTRTWKADPLINSANTFRTSRLH